MSNVHQAFIVENGDAFSVESAPDPDGKIAVRLTFPTDTGLTKAQARKLIALLSEIIGDLLA